MAMLKLCKLVNPPVIKSLIPLSPFSTTTTKFYVDKKESGCGSGSHARPGSKFTAKSTSVQRQNYHPECEKAVNNQVNMELYASYVYLSMATHFDRDDVALPGFRKFFHAAHLEEIEHATMLLDFQNMRGGRAEFFDVLKPKVEKWGDTKSMVLAALQLEMEVNQSLLDLSGLATKHNDINMTDFLDDFLMEQVRGQKMLADMLKNVSRVEEGLGIYELDQRLLKNPQAYALVTSHEINKS
ncbi:unnamed protein product [Bemisia tabaci]|uniref:Ferritin n=1 Tax=Bemisia tabaci TaxID=7038 RepID=A0A9N9ZYM9_BEMTA|nr:unnamed protein product [Bemisia tabaci]